MTFFLRGVRKARWYKDFKEYPWLQPLDVPADPLGDLATQDNTISVYIVEDQEAVGRVVAALAATRDTISNFDYALFRIETLEHANFKIHQELGKTPDAIVNMWHRDVTELSAIKLLDLLQKIWEEVKTDRKSQKEVVELIRKGISLGHLEQSKIKGTILDKLDK